MKNNQQQNNNNCSEDVNLKFTSSTKQNVRKCIGCGKKLDKKQLIKITREHSSGKILIQPNSEQFGRSAYLCYNDECIKNAFKKKRLQKALKVNISEQLLNDLKSVLN